MYWSKIFYSILEFLQKIIKLVESTLWMDNCNFWVFGQLFFLQLQYINNFYFNYKTKDFFKWFVNFFPLRPKFSSTCHTPSSPILSLPLNGSSRKKTILALHNVKNANKLTGFLSSGASAFCLLLGVHSTKNDCSSEKPLVQSLGIRANTVYPT